MKRGVKIVLVVAIILAVLGISYYFLFVYKTKATGKPVLSWGQINEEPIEVENPRG